MDTPRSPQASELAQAVNRAREVVAKPSDEELWTQLQVNHLDQDAIAELYRRWSSPLRYRCMRCGLSRDDADAVLNGAFIKLLGRPRQKPFAFLWKVVKRDAQKACQRNARRYERERAGDTTVAAVADPRKTETPLANQELATAVDAALNRLCESERMAVILHHVMGLPVREAAGLMGCRERSVETYLSRAKAHMSKWLSRWRDAVPAAGGLALTASSAAAAPSPEQVSAATAAILAGLRKAAVSAWLFGKVAAAVGVVLAVGGLALGGWALTREKPRKEQLTQQVTDTTQPAVPLQDTRETLQEKNVRLTHEFVVPLIRTELQKMLPADNSIELVEVRPMGSKVECEFRTAKALLDGRAGVRIRFCVLQRSMEMDADLFGKSVWKLVSPDRPIFLEFDVPLLPRWEGASGRERYEAIRRAFEQLPGDERAEREAILWRFGSLRPAEGELVLPSGGWRAIAGNSRTLFVHAPDEGLYALRDGTWQYEGNCSGWLRDADEERLYRVEGSWIYARPIDPRNAQWTRYCLCPVLPKSVHPLHLRAGGGFLFMTTAEPVLWRRPLGTTGAWVREPLPWSPDPFAVVGDRLVTAHGREFLSRPAREPGDWTAGELPAGVQIVRPGIQGVTAWRGQVLLYDMTGGPIYARSLGAESWKVIGRVGPVAK